MSNKTTRIGIVGCGFITQQVHIPALRRCKNTQIVAVCDVFLETATKVSKEFNIAGTYNDFTQMLNKENLDVVHVCTSIDTHAELAIQAMEAGCHVLTEKPMAANTKEADREVEVSQRTGMKLCVIHQLLFNPVVMKMKSTVDKGVLGDITRVEIRQSCPPWDYPPIADPNHWWHRLPGGVFGDTLPHPIYLARHFLGDIEPEAVYSRKLGNYEHLPIDEVQILLSGKTGMSTILTSCNWPSLWQIDIYGTKKCLHGDLNNSYMYAYSCKTNNGRGIATSYIKENLSRSFQILNNSLDTGFKMLKGQHRGHFVQIGKFIESVQTNTKPPVAGEDDRDVTRLVEDITGRM